MGGGFYQIYRHTQIFFFENFSLTKAQVQTQTMSSISQEEIDDLIMDARAGDLESLKEYFDNLEKSKIVEILPKIKDEYSLSTVLHMAAANGHLEIIQYIIGLCDEEPEVVIELMKAKNESGNTPLHWAALNGNLDVIKQLCDSGSDPFIQNEAGRDAIYEAEAFEQEEVVDYLLQRYNIEPVEDDDEQEVSEQVENVELKDNE